MSGYPQQQRPPGQFPSGNPFAEQINPYAAPQVGGYQPSMPVVGNHPFAGLWRQGNLLVMHKLAPLPEICLLSNQPATRRLKRTMYWHHPAIYIAMISPVIYIILALIFQKNATIEIALTEEWFARRRRRLFFAWGVGLLGLGLFTSAIALGNSDLTPWALLFASVLSLAALIYGLIACRLITPQRITDQYVFVSGVHLEFLDRLEVWNWNV